MEFVYIMLTGLLGLFIFGVTIKCVRQLIEDYVETVTIWDYQTGLHFRHGRYQEILAAGKYRFLGKGHSVILSDNRISELVVQGQELITADSATLKLTAVAQWRIADAKRFHDAAGDPRQALYTLIQLAMRRVIGGLELDAVIEQKADFGKALIKEVKADALAELGIEVARVEIRDVMLGSDLKGVYTGVITARKEAQAKQEQARGEAAALRTFANAARAFENNPELFRLRYLETLKEAGAGYGNQLIIGVPEELMAAVKKD